MALADILGSQQNAFQSSFLRAESNRRTNANQSLQQKMQGQQFEQNALRMQAQKKQAEMISSRQKLVQEYGGDAGELVDALMGAGDLEGASNVVAFENKVATLDDRERKIAIEKRNTMTGDVLDTSASVLEAFKRDDSGREGMLLAIEQGQRLRQEYEGAQIPDFRGMRPDQVQSWMQNTYNRSLSNRQFEQRKKHQADMATARQAGGSDAYSRLGAKVADKTATADEISRFKILSGSKPRPPVEGTQARFDKRMNFNIKKHELVKSKDKRAATTAYRKEARNDIATLRGMDEQIDVIFKGLEIGGSLGAKMVKVALSKIANSKVRAIAELNEFKIYGPLDVRVAGHIKRFLTGEPTDAERQEAFELATWMRKTYTEPGIAASKRYYRTLAKNGGLSPHEVAKYTSAEEVLTDFAGKDKLLTREQARLILEDNPQWEKKIK